MANLVTITESMCKGCALCADACPKNILEMAKDRVNNKGYHPATCINMAACTACAICAKMCPDSAIRVERDA
ncbi:MAG: 4Fe-4S binding protein [Defluviitaleaceae bacterium]|nr:4Fe-4S binding protein [Defluviitaleaceae bacterium]